MRATCISVLCVEITLYNLYIFNILDIDECATDDTCQQICVNTPGGFTCMCDGQYRQSSDGEDCICEYIRAFTSYVGFFFASS